MNRAAVLLSASLRRTLHLPVLYSAIAPQFTGAKRKTATLLYLRKLLDEKQYF
jgi:hypothetical protein